MKLTRVSRLAVADDLVRGMLHVAGICIWMSTAWVTRARTGPAVFSRTQNRITVIPTCAPEVAQNAMLSAWHQINTFSVVDERYDWPLTLMTCCVFPAVKACTSVRVTGFWVSITLAWPAVWEAPVTMLAFRALSAKSPGLAGALPCNWVTLLSIRAIMVAVTGWNNAETLVTHTTKIIIDQSVAGNITNTAVGSKSICSWCTLVTTTANYVGSTLTLTTYLFTLHTQWTLRITVASYKEKK